MPIAHPQISPEAYLRDVFGAKAVRDGKIIRRDLRDVERFVGRKAFVAELNRRGFRGVENAGQIVIFCNREPVKIVR